MVLLAVRAERPHDVRDREVMNRRIEKGKRGALARAVQRGSGRQLRPALDVAGRQRAQPARQLRSREIGEMTSLERREPRRRGRHEKIRPSTHFVRSGHSP